VLVTHRFYFRCTFSCKDGHPPLGPLRPSPGCAGSNLIFSASLVTGVNTGLACVLRYARPYHDFDTVQDAIRDVLRDLVHPYDTVGLRSPGGFLLRFPAILACLRDHFATISRSFRIFSNLKSCYLVENTLIMCVSA